MILEKEQEELLSTLVEASRNVPRQRRQSFLAYLTASDSSLKWGIMHEGLPGGQVEVPECDLNILRHSGLLAAQTVGRDTIRFDISPRGLEYYEKTKKEAAEPAERVEDEIDSYLKSDQFQRKYPKAYQKWIEAESKLWCSDSPEQYTVIGHLCREATQEFTNVLVELLKPQDIDDDIKHTKSRLKRVIGIRSGQLGDTEKPVLDALIAYWDVLSDHLVNRQEHGAQKEGTPLVWEDGRRLVFLTAVAMFEIDRAISRGQQ